MSFIYIFIMYCFGWCQPSTDKTKVLKDLFQETINKTIKNWLTLTIIHTRQLNFLFSDWLFSKYAECIKNVHCTPRTAPRLCPDCARCFWCVIARTNVTSTVPFFSLGKVVNILYVWWHFKTILFIIFHEHEQMILFFCRVWIRLIHLHLLLLVK